MTHRYNKILQIVSLKSQRNHLNIQLMMIMNNRANLTVVHNFPPLGKKIWWLLKIIKVRRICLIDRVGLRQVHLYIKHRLLIFLAKLNHLKGIRFSLVIQQSLIWALICILLICKIELIVLHKKKSKILLLNQIQLLILSQIRLIFWKKIKFNILN